MLCKAGDQMAGVTFPQSNKLLEFHRNQKSIFHFYLPLPTITTTIITHSLSLPPHSGAFAMQTLHPSSSPSLFSFLLIIILEGLSGNLLKGFKEDHTGFEDDLIFKVNELLAACPSQDTPQAWPKPQNLSTLPHPIILKRDWVMDNTPFATSWNTYIDDNQGPDKRSYVSIERMPSFPFNPENPFYPNPDYPSDLTPLPICNPSNPNTNPYLVTHPIFAKHDVWVQKVPSFTPLHFDPSTTISTLVPTILLIWVAKLWVFWKVRAKKDWAKVHNSELPQILKNPGRTGYHLDWLFHNFINFPIGKCKGLKSSWLQLWQMVWVLFRDDHGVIGTKLREFWGRLEAYHGFLGGRVEELEKIMGRHKRKREKKEAKAVTGRRLTESRVKPRGEMSELYVVWFGK
ncbi:hypothetical protein BC829DRAFT_415291 [Chytridium lagenaria]|nr:hypothetical protein BC829DRAFT_415291 [Chytridium lagenaria]